MTIYFDVTDIVHYAARYSRVTGIQRVQLNIINLLARKHGGNIIRCTFFDLSRKAMFEFDPATRPDEVEFDAENFLVDLGLLRRSRIFPSKVQLKSYLRRYNNNKIHRTLKKIGVYLTALFMPRKLAALGFVLNKRSPAQYGSVALSSLPKLPAQSRYVCMGSVWLYPQVWQFAHEHRANGGEVVQMVYDLIPLLYPQFLPKNEPTAFSDWMNSALHYTSRFMCISEWTASDLKKYANETGHRPVVRAIPLAHEFMGYSRTAPKAVLPQFTELAGTNYVLCVGTIEHRKNGMTLLKVWQQLVAELGQQMPLLVFAGKYGKGGAEFQQYLDQQSELSKYVRLIHAPSDQGLAWLYGNALFSVFPSVIEGWGLPVGESAWFGKFCVASNATSIPEVCGDLVDYVDPTDADSIKAGLKRVITDPAYLKQRERAIAAAELRKWSDVADDIFDFATAAFVEPQRVTVQRLA